ncbi:hypothetical protein L6R53_18705 [Myxococcota bacterium]|nr:hypothetical protein [Myxococcota bacterium]
MRSPEALAAQALVARGLPVSEVDAAALVVHVEDRQARVGLGNLRRILALSPPEEHEARAAAWARAVQEGLAGQAEQGPWAERLVPRLLAQADPRLWTAPLAPGLHLALALDSPLHQRLLSPFDLPRLGLGLVPARARAVANLRAATPPPAWQGPVATWAVGDGLDAARMLLAGAWERGAAGALAVAPTRDLCRFLPLRAPADLEAVGRLRAGLPDLATAPYPLSSALWWVPSGEGSICAVPHRAEGGRVVLSLPDDLLRRLR